MVKTIKGKSVDFTNFIILSLSKLALAKLIFLILKKYWQMDRIYNHIDIFYNQAFINK